MVVDLLNETIGKKQSQKKTLLKRPTEKYYFLTSKIISTNNWAQVSIFGTKVDQKATTLFLPFDLMESLKATKYKNEPLSEPVVSLLTVAPTTPHSWWNNAYTYGAFLLLLVFWKKRSIGLLFLTLMGVLGLFFLFMGWYSLHPELANNYNVLLFNPTLLVLVFFVLKKIAKP